MTRDSGTLSTRKTVWIEMPNGTGHWASNWELGRMSEDEYQARLTQAELDAEEFEGGYPWPNL